MYLCIFTIRACRFPYPIHSVKHVFFATATLVPLLLAIFGKKKKSSNFFMPRFQCVLSIACAVRVVHHSKDAQAQGEIPDRACMLLSSFFLLCTFDFHIWGLFRVVNVLGIRFQPRLTRMDAAVDAMLPLGFPEKRVKKHVKQLLKVNLDSFPISSSVMVSWFPVVRKERKNAIDC